MSRCEVEAHPWVLSCIFFFFQAEDGIRDTSVTGVQTCALPISASRSPTAGRFTYGPATMKAGSPWMRRPSPNQPLLEQEPQNMPATSVDSVIFGNLFSTEAMRQVWSDENRTRKYLDIEAALARVQARLGIIPAKAAAEIVRNCRLERIDPSKLRAQTERIGYPVLGVVQQLVELCADGLGEWGHWGATTQDITDTAR